MSTCKLDINSINRKGGTQTRAGLHTDTVHKYATLMAPDDGDTLPAEFPPVVVFHDGTDNWLADGFHRVAAAKKAGFNEVEADVRTGTKADALWYAAACNSRHGLPATNADKRRAIVAVLNHDELCRKSAKQIAEHVGCSARFVRQVRREQGITPDGGVMDTEGRARAAKTLAEAGGGLSSRALAKAAGVSRKVARAVLERGGPGGTASTGPTLEGASRPMPEPPSAPQALPEPREPTPPPSAVEPEPVVLPDGAPAHLDAVFDIATLGREAARTLNRLHREAKAEVKRVNDAIFAALGHDPKLLATMRHYMPSEANLDGLKHTATGLTSDAPVRVCPLCEGRGVSARGAKCIACHGKGWQDNDDIGSANALATAGRGR